MSRRRHADHTRAVTPAPVEPAPPDPATRLRAAIDQLTEPTTVIIERARQRYPGCWCQSCADVAACSEHDRHDLAHFPPTVAATRIAARRTTTATVPSPLEQLLQLHGSTNSKDGGPAHGIYRSLIHPQITELLADIRHTTDAPRTGDLVEHVRAWARNAEHLDAAADHAEHWAAQADQLLNPPRRWSHPAPCPACGHATAHIRDDTGELVRRPALEFDRTTGTARCLACPATWDHNQIEWLGTVLRDQQPAPPKPAIRSIAHGRGGPWLTPAPYPHQPRIAFPLWALTATRQEHHA